MRVRQLVSPGSRPMTLVRRRVSPKVRSMKLECRIALMVFGGEPQVGGQARGVGGQGLHRGGVGGRVPGGHLADPRVDQVHQLRAGRRLKVPGVEDFPVGVLDLGLYPGRDLGQDVPGTGGSDIFGAAPSGRPARSRRSAPGAPSLMTSSGEARPRSLRSARKAVQASADSPVPGARPMNAGLPLVVMPQAASTGSAGEPGCIQKKDDVQEQVVQGDVIETAGGPPLILVLDLLADRRDRGLGDRGLIAQRLRQGGLHVPDRQATHERGDHQRSPARWSW